MRMQGCSTPGPAAADHQHISRVLRREIDIVLDWAVTLQQRGQLDHGSVSLVGTEPNRSIGAGAIVRMIFMDQLIAVCGREFRNRLLATGIPCLMHDLLECVDVHLFSPSMVTRHEATAKREPP